MLSRGKTIWGRTQRKVGYAVGELETREDGTGLVGDVGMVRGNGLETVCQSGCIHGYGLTSPIWQKMTVQVSGNSLDDYLQTG